MQDPIISAIRYTCIEWSENDDAYFEGGGAAPAYYCMTASTQLTERPPMSGKGHPMEPRHSHDKVSLHWSFLTPM